MLIKDTPKALADWKRGMSLEEIAKKYELNDRNHAVLAITMGQRLNIMKGVDTGDAEGT